MREIDQRSRPGEILEHFPSNVRPMLTTSYIPVHLLDPTSREKLRHKARLHSIDLVYLAKW